MFYLVAWIHQNNWKNYNLNTSIKWRFFILCPVWSNEKLLEFLWIAFCSDFRKKHIFLIFRKIKIAVKFRRFGILSRKVTSLRFWKFSCTFEKMKSVIFFSHFLSRTNKGVSQEQIARWFGGLKYFFRVFGGHVNAMGWKKKH